MLLTVAIGLAAISLLTLLANPVAGIVVLFIVRPVIDTTYATLVVSSFSLTHLVGVISPLLVLGHLLVFKPEEGLGRSPLRLLWLIYAVDITLFSILIALHQDWESGASAFFRYINGVVGFFMVQTYFHESRRFKLLLLGLIVAGVFPVGMGVYQTFHGVEWQYAQTEGLTRYVGLYHDAFTNRFYAMQTVMALLLYFSLYVRSGPVPLAALMAGLGPTAVVLLKAYSKAGLLTLGIWMVCWTALQKKYATLLVVATSTVVLALVYFPTVPSDIGRLFHKELGALAGTVDVNLTFQGRWFGWKEMIDRWTDFPLLAKVFGSGETAFGAHNDYLQMLYHGGVLGLAIYVTLLVAVGLRLLRAVRATRTPVTIAGLMLYLMWLIDAIGLVPSSYPGYQWFIWGIIGLSLRLSDAKLVAEPHIPQAVVPVRRGDAGAGFEVLQAIPAAGRRYPLVSS